MWLPVLALILGVLFGTIFTISIPVVYAKYLSIAVLAGLDSLIGGLRAVQENKFDGPILLSGFFTNTLLAAGLAYLGDMLGLDLYLAAVVTFGLRIFANIGFIRRRIIEKFRGRKTNNIKTFSFFKFPHKALNQRNHADNVLDHKLNELKQDDNV